MSYTVYTLQCMQTSDTSYNLQSKGIESLEATQYELLVLYESDKAPDRTAVAANWNLLVV